MIYKEMLLWVVSEYIKPYNINFRSNVVNNTRN